MRTSPQAAAARAFSLGLLLVFAIGCSKPSYPVTGTVTLDGKPLPNATVSFIPEGGKAALGADDTDDQGKFTLQQTADTPGLPAGKYKVGISTEKNDDHGNQLAPERLPERYWGVDTELRAEIKADGPNNLDFPLKGGIPVKPKAKGKVPRGKP